MVDGTNYIIWIDTVTPRSNGYGMDYRPVMCGVSNNFGMENQGIEYRNKNDGGWVDSLPGYSTWSIDMDGQAIGIRNSEAVIKANFEQIAQLFLAKQSFWIKQTDAEQTIVREGWCRIGTYRETSNMNEPYSFTVTFVGRGVPNLNSDGLIIPELSKIIFYGSSLTKPLNQAAIIALNQIEFSTEPFILNTGIHRFMTVAYPVGYNLISAENITANEDVLSEYLMNSFNVNSIPYIIRIMETAVPYPINNEHIITIV